VPSCAVVNGIRYLTLQEYADWKRISYKSAWRAKQRGEIPVERVGKSDRIPVRVDAEPERSAA
jgi:hypothetical protein